MLLLTATRKCRADANARRLRKLARLLEELDQKIADEFDSLLDSFDSIAATAAFSMEALENGDQSEWLPAQLNALGASLAWHSNRLSQLKEQADFVGTAKGTLKFLLAVPPEERVSAAGGAGHTRFGGVCVPKQGRKLPTCFENTVR